MIEKVKPGLSYIFTGATQRGLHTSSYPTVRLYMAIEPNHSTKPVHKGVFNEPLLFSQIDINSGLRRWNLDTYVNLKLHMGEPEDEITISSDGPSSFPTKLALFFLFVAICYSALAGIDVGSFTSEIDCDDPVPEAWEETCNNSKKDSSGQFCCVIIPLFLSFVLFLLPLLSKISPYEEE